MNKIEVVGLGALNMDYIYKVEHIIGDREIMGHTPEYEDSELESLGAFPGGSAANTIYGLAKLRTRTGFIGVVGDDDDGNRVIQDFQKVGVDTSQIKVKPKAKTGLARCLSDKLNFRSIHLIPGANSLLTMDNINLEYINRAKMLHISSFVGDSQFRVLLELIDRLEPAVEVSFAPGALFASRGLKALKPILARTRVLFINRSEIQELTGKDFSAGAEVCLNLGCHIVVVTLGQGAIYKTRMATSYIRTAEGEYAVEPGDKSIISAADTIGAGDAFAAGFLYGLLNGKELEKCGRLGDVVARFSISETGARGGLPTLAELTKRYQDLYSGEL